ncbi:hypothetical protein McPS_21150 [Marichromatium sp. PS1]|uniref:DUF5677 domain-containing protein n=1 Tax=Marichromatium sp. PS1 TaxID=3138932 RepID=UPI0032E65C36
MLGLQEYFDQLIQEQFEPHRLGVKILECELERNGVHITSEQRKDLEEQFKRIGQNELNFDFSDSQLEKAGFSSKVESKQKLQEIIDNFPKYIDAFSGKIDGIMESLLPSVVDKMAESVSKTLQSRMEEMLEDQYAIQSEFDDNLYNIWGEALELLQGLIVISDEAAQGYLQRSDKYSENDITQHLLVRLHAKANQISKEILHLITHGFADGAQARWRSLHELAVVCSFIAEHGDSVAERYAQHESVEIYKAAKQYNQYCSRLGAEKINDSEMAVIEREYLELIERYGRSYASDYGWAAATLNLSRPTFRCLEVSVELDHIRPYYKAASANIHANPAGVFRRLGLFPEEDALLAGPSNIGLSDPAQSTAISLTQITTSVLIYGANIDFLVVCKAMAEYSKSVESKFIEIENEVHKQRNA